MSEWKECKLGEIAEIVMGQSPKGETCNTNGFGFPLLNGPTEFGISSPKAIQFTTDSKKECKRLDILFCVRGSTTGKMNYADQKYSIGRGLAAIRHKKGIEYRYFLKGIIDYYLEHLLSSATGSTFPNITGSQIIETKILLPTLQEQIAIAEIFSSLDNKINLLHRQNTTLEKMAETLFRQWFVEEAKEEWEYQLNLGDLIESVSITHKFPNSEIVFLNTSDIYLGNVLEHSPTVVKGLPGQAKKSIQKDDILFSEIRPANGRWAYVEFEADDYVVSTKLMVLRSKKVLSQAFVYFYLTNSSTVEWLQMIAESRSGTFPQITFEQLRDMKISVPSNEILNNTIDWCEASLKKIKSNQIQIRTLTAMRDNLLPKLMSGEVRVKL